jgi:hypothetical protein
MESKLLVVAVVVQVQLAEMQALELVVMAETEKQVQLLEHL